MTLMRTTSIELHETPLVLYVLRRADDALILGHRLSEWTGHAPLLEEELALANIALDLIGQARLLYQHAAEQEGDRLSEDDLAYRRDPPQFRNLLLLEQPNGDFAVTIVRQVFYSALAEPYWRAMMQSADESLAAIAAKAVKEIAYHLRHSGEWLIRMGDGTEESHARTQAAVEQLWPYVGEMFEADETDRGLIAAGVAADPEQLRPQWETTVGALLRNATLVRPEAPWFHSGGRTGRHTEHLGHLLAEMQVLPRTYPGASW